jgi:hypothetical protein
VWVIPHPTDWRLYRPRFFPRGQKENSSNFSPFQRDKLFSFVVHANVVPRWNPHSDVRVLFYEEAPD